MPLLFKKGELKSDSASLTNIECFSWFLTLCSYSIENQRSSCISRVVGVCVCVTQYYNIEVIWPLIILIGAKACCIDKHYQIDYNIVY